jgi:hypothetical protein
MEVIVERVAGLDIHKKSITAAVRTPDGSGGRIEQVRTFSAFLAGLQALRAWLLTTSCAATSGSSCASCPSPTSPRSQGRPLGTAEEPRGPHRQPGRDPDPDPPARRDEPSRVQDAVARLPTQGSLPRHLRWRPHPPRGRRAARPLVLLGPTLPARPVRQGRTHRAQTSRGHPRCDPARTHQRKTLGPQPARTSDHATRLRVPLRDGRTRPGDALRRPYPPPAALGASGMNTPTSMPEEPTSPAGDRGCPRRRTRARRGATPSRIPSVPDAGQPFGIGPRNSGRARRHRPRRPHG